jgi:hypothetical protein
MRFGRQRFHQLTSWQQTEKYYVKYTGTITYRAVAVQQYTLRAVAGSVVPFSFFFFTNKLKCRSVVRSSCITTLQQHSTKETVVAVIVD